METMEQLIQKYSELKSQIAALEAQKKEIAAKFKAGLLTFGITSFRVLVGDATYQLKLTSRVSHSCQWEAFKNVHPDIYTQFVNDSSVEYVDVRPVINGNRGAAE